MPKPKGELQKAIRRLDHFETLKDQIEMTVAAEGLRIELLETESETFFESVNLTPKPERARVVDRARPRIGQTPEQGLD